MSEKAEKSYTWVFDDSESTDTIFEENLEKILEKFEKVVRHNSSIKSVFDTFFPEIQNSTQVMLEYEKSWF